MGVGLSAQGVNMNRLPGKLKFFLLKLENYDMCLFRYQWVLV